MIDLNFPFYLLVTSGYLIVTCGYLVVASGYLIATTGYFWLRLVTSRYFSLLSVPRFSNNDKLHLNSSQVNIRFILVRMETYIVFTW